MQLGWCLPSGVLPAGGKQPAQLEARSADADSRPSPGANGTGATRSVVGIGCQGAHKQSLQHWQPRGRVCFGACMGLGQGRGRPAASPGEQNGLSVSF